MVLYEDVEVVREFERFFYEAHAHAQESRTLPQMISESQDDAQDALFLVSSAIHVQHGVFVAQQRLAQTIDTCESIKKRCPASRIILLDGGVQRLSENELHSLAQYVWRIESFTDHKEVIEAHRASRQDIVKNAIEIYMYKAFFGSITNNDALSVATFTRIFKVSGRYSLNDEFDYHLHRAADQKVVICGPHISQFSSDITGGIHCQYMSRLWSFDISLLAKISKCYDAMWQDFSARLSRACYADIEHLLFHHLDPADVLSVKRIGIQGAIASIGNLVVD